MENTLKKNVFFLFCFFTERTINRGGGHSEPTLNPYEKKTFFLRFQKKLPEPHETEENLIKQIECYVRCW